MEQISSFEIWYTFFYQLSPVWIALFITFSALFIWRKNLGIPPREKTEDINLPQLDKKAIQQKVRSTLYKYPIIPFLFYGAAILILIGGLFFVFKSFNIA